LHDWKRRHAYDAAQKRYRYEDDDAYRHVRVQAARALAMLRAGEAAGALRRALETERGRAEPPPIHERMPIPTGDEAEAALRDALRALTDGPARSSGS